MNVRMKKKCDVLSVAVEGRLDTMTAPDLEEQLEPALKGVKKLIFDFAELNYISSAGLRILLISMQIMNEQGEMVVRNVKPQIMDVFEVTGFIDDLNIE